MPEPSSGLARPHGEPAAWRGGGAAADVPTDGGAKRYFTVLAGTFVLVDVSAAVALAAVREMHLFGFTGYTFGPGALETLLNDLTHTAPLADQGNSEVFFRSLRSYETGLLLRELRALLRFLDSIGFVLLSVVLLYWFYVRQGLYLTRFGDLRSDGDSFLSRQVLRN